MAELVDVSLMRSFGRPCSPDNAIGALSDDILNVILFRDVEGDLPRARRRLRARGGSRHWYAVAKAFGAGGEDWDAAQCYTAEGGYSTTAGINATV